MKRCICALNNAAKRKPTLPTLGSRQLHTPTPFTTPILPATIPHPYSSTQFTIPPLLPFPNATSPYESQGKGKGKSQRPETPRSNEEEVDDAEWQMRVGRAMLHLRDTLPKLLESGHSSSELFPTDIYSTNVVLKLPAPLPIRITSLSGYSVAFSIARNGMQAFHTDLLTVMDRMTFSPAPTSSSSTLSRLMLNRKPIPAHRQKQVRVSLSLYGTPRFPPHKESIWRTSSLYTFSPHSGLIASHEVETIRPLPGEGVSEWLMNRLLGWTSRQNEGLAPCPRAVPVRVESWDKMTKGDGSERGN